MAAAAGAEDIDAFFDALVQEAEEPSGRAPAAAPLNPGLEAASAVTAKSLTPPFPHSLSHSLHLQTAAPSAPPAANPSPAPLAAGLSLSASLPQPAPLPQGVSLPQPAPLPQGVSLPQPASLPQATALSQGAGALSSRPAPPGSFAEAARPRLVQKGPANWTPNPAEASAAAAALPTVQTLHQQRRDAAFEAEPPELRAEPPFDFVLEGGTAATAAAQKARTAALCTSAAAVSRLIESKLRENEQMLFAVNENLVAGRFEESLCFFERLQQNLFFLAMLADQHTQDGGEQSLDAQREAFRSNADFWTLEELQRLHHALRIPRQDVEQLAAAVGSKDASQIQFYVARAADRQLLHQAQGVQTAAAAAPAPSDPSAASAGSAVEADATAAP